MPTSKKLSQQPVVTGLLAGDRLPVLRRAVDESDASKRNPTAGAQAVADWLGQAMSPNSSRSLLKEFRFFRKADRDADGYGGACFETDLDWATCCGNTVAIIDFYRESDTEPFRNQRLVCVYDPAPTDPTHQAWVDGSFTGLRNPSKFVPEGSVAAQLANIPVFDPTKTDYLAGTVVQYTIGGKVFLYQIVAAGGPFAAPTDPKGGGTADLKAIGEPQPVDAYTKSEVNALLATKQGALVKSAQVNLSGNAYAMPRTLLGQRVLFYPVSATTITLPTVTLADVGTVVAVTRGGGPGNGGTLTFTDAKSDSFTLTSVGHTVFAEVVSLERGTPFRDTVASWVAVAEYGASGKLYTAPGQQTDGALTVKATTDALAKKGNLALRRPSLFSEVTLVELTNGEVNTLSPWGAYAFISDLRVNLPPSWGTEGVAAQIYIRADAACTVTFPVGELDGQTSVSLVAGETRTARGDIMDPTSTNWKTVERGSVLSLGSGGGGGGGGTSYTDAQAKAAALASLIAGNSQHQGVQVVSVGGVPKLTISGTEVLSIIHFQAQNVSGNAYSDLELFTTYRLDVLDGLYNLDTWEAQVLGPDGLALSAVVNTADNLNDALAQAFAGAPAFVLVRHRLLRATTTDVAQARFTYVLV